MPLRLSKTQAKQYGLRAPKAATSTRQRYGGYASSWEREYADYLSQDMTIKAWQYEAIRLILAPKTTYLPDFFVTRLDGRLEIREVKGYLREKDNIKLKVAAKMFPMFRFYLVRKVGDRWDHKLINS
jgi:hypothetical protein